MADIGVERETPARYVVPIAILVGWIAARQFETFIYHQAGCLSPTAKVWLEITAILARFAIIAGAIAIAVGHRPRLPAPAPWRYSVSRVIKYWPIEAAIALGALLIPTSNHPGGTIVCGTLVRAGTYNDTIAHGSGLYWVGEFLAGCVGAAVTEELVFRAGILAGLAAIWPQHRHLAVWISAALFAAAHWGTAGGYTLVQIVSSPLSLGVFSGYVYLATGDLRPSILIHATSNLLITAYQYGGTTATVARIVLVLIYAAILTANFGSFVPLMRPRLERNGLSPNPNGRHLARLPSQTRAFLDGRHPDKENTPQPAPANDTNMRPADQRQRLG